MPIWTICRIFSAGSRLVFKRTVSACAYEQFPSFCSIPWTFITAPYENFGLVLADPSSHIAVLGAQSAPRRHRPTSQVLIHGKSSAGALGGFTVDADSRRPRVLPASARCAKLRHALPLLRLAEGSTRVPRAGSNHLSGVLRNEAPCRNSVSDRKSTRLNSSHRL